MPNPTIELHVKEIPISLVKNLATSIYQKVFVTNYTNEKGKIIPNNHLIDATLGALYEKSGEDQRNEPVIGFTVPTDLGLQHRYIYRTIVNQMKDINTSGDENGSRKRDRITGDYKTSREIVSTDIYDQFKGVLKCILPPNYLSAEILLIDAEEERLEHFLQSLDVAIVYTLTSIFLQNQSLGTARETSVFADLPKLTVQNMVVLAMYMFGKSFSKTGTIDDVLLNIIDALWVHSRLPIEGQVLWHAEYPQLIERLKNSKSYHSKQIKNTILRVCFPHLTNDELYGTEKNRESLRRKLGHARDALAFVKTGVLLQWGPLAEYSIEYGQALGWSIQKSLNIVNRKRKVFSAEKLLRNCKSELDTVVNQKQSRMNQSQRWNSLAPILFDAEWKDLSIVESTKLRRFIRSTAIIAEKIAEQTSNIPMYIPGQNPQ